MLEVLFHELLREYVQGFQLPGLKDQAFGSWTKTGCQILVNLTNLQSTVKLKQESDLGSYLYEIKRAQIMSS